MSGVTGHLHSPDYMSNWVSECVYSYSARTPKVLNTIVSHEQVSTFDLTPEKSTNVTRTLFFGWNCGTATVWIIWITLFSCRSYKNPRTNNSTIRTHTHTRLMALFPGLPRWASTRKVKPIKAGCPSCRPTNSVKALKAVILLYEHEINARLPAYNATKCKNLQFYYHDSTIPSRFKWLLKDLTWYYIISGQLKNIFMHKSNTHVIIISNGIRTLLHKYSMHKMC